MIPTYTTVCIVSICISFANCLSYPGSEFVKNFLTKMELFKKLGRLLAISLTLLQNSGNLFGKICSVSRRH